MDMSNIDKMIFMIKRFLGITFGIILLASMGMEYANASKQLHTYANSTLFLIIPVILFCTWLIGGCFSKRKLRIKSFDYVRYFIMSLVIFLFAVFIGAIKSRMPSRFVKVNGIPVAIDMLDEGSKKLIPNAEKREEYCVCVAEKLANSEQVVSNYEGDLRIGRLDKVLKEIQKEEYFDSLNIASCVVDSELNWTDAFADGMVKVSVLPTGSMTY